MNRRKRGWKSRRVIWLDTGPYVWGIIENINVMGTKLKKKGKFKGKKKLILALTENVAWWKVKEREELV